MEISLDINYVLNSKNYKYSGEVPNNTEKEYNSIKWEDSRKKPSWEEIKILWSEIEKNLLIIYCKSNAKTLISNSDWSVLSDVQIQNKSEFIAYREILRNYILNPVENPIFPPEPSPIWTINN